jgi:hypothetical protein
MHRISLPCEIAKGSLVNLSAETSSYMTAKKKIKFVARHVLLTRCLVKDRADMAFAEYLYHNCPLFPYPHSMVNG